MIYLRIDLLSKWKDKIQTHHWPSTGCCKCNLLCCQVALGSLKGNIHQEEFSHFGIWRWPSYLLETITLPAGERGSCPVRLAWVFRWRGIWIPREERAASGDRGWDTFRLRWVIRVGSGQGGPAAKLPSVLTRLYYLNEFTSVQSMTLTILESKDLIWSLLPGSLGAEKVVKVLHSLCTRLELWVDTLS